MMRQAPEVILLELESAAQLLVAAITGEQTESQALAFLDGINHVSSVVVNFVVSKIDRVENSESSQFVPSLLCLNGI